MLRTQNLTDGRQSLFWWGRAWWKSLRCEWSFGKRARGLAAKVILGESDDDDGLMIHICVPFLVSVFFSIDGILHTRKSTWTGFYIFENSFYWAICSNRWESHSRDPWWRKTHGFDFPWALTWHSTEVLREWLGMDHEVVFREDRKSRTSGDTFDLMRKKEEVEHSVQFKAPYRYVLKSGAVQDVEATVHLDRMEWRARWYPLIPIRKVRTSINVKFSEEVGEEAGSWKGGCVGCGYDLHPNETAIECLRRMEREREFKR